MRVGEIYTAPVLLFRLGVLAGALIFFCGPQQAQTSSAAKASPTTSAVAAKSPGAQKRTATPAAKSGGARKSSTPSSKSAAASRKPTANSTQSAASTSKAATAAGKSTAAAKPPAVQAPAKKATAQTAAKRVSPKTKVRRASRWSEPTFADSTIGDRLDGEDLTVRRAAVQALGRYNGSVVVVDPDTGRILSMVNQKTALTAAFQPCSTIKIPIAMAALAEGLIDRSTIVRVAGGRRLTLTEAMARSDNPYFASLGEKLGFERVSYYVRLMGLGEKAGWRIEGEQPGVLPQEPPAEGVGMMSSFGSGIAMTPLQLASMLTALANGGTLYYLQYPRTNEELRDFTPRVKRFLNIEHWLQEIEPGMLGAVEFGTARRAYFDPESPIFGKTGTCTDRRTHLGWFGSFAEIGGKRLVVVVLLTGGAGIGGSVAAEIAGNTYRLLAEEGFFADRSSFATSSILSTGACCTQ